jgi:hypothetical protein
MRKVTKGLLAGLMVVGLLMAVAPPASAQGAYNQGGIADPLSLAASGVVIPFFQKEAGDVSFLELASPVGPNGLNCPPASGCVTGERTFITGEELHLIWFNAACVRQTSTSLPMSPNDLEILQLDSNPWNLGANDGLIAIGKIGPTDFELRPLTYPLHTRVYWFNIQADRLKLARVIEPITLDSADFPSGGGSDGGSPAGPVVANYPHQWNPLRTAATFFAPNETDPGFLHTNLVLICPKSTVQSNSATGGVFPGANFPWFIAPGNEAGTNLPRPGFPSAYSTSSTPVNTSAGTGATGSLRAVIYDVNEKLLRDVRSNCDCVFKQSVLNIDAVYGNVVEAPDGTYTEIQADPTPTADFGFTGYKVLSIVGERLEIPEAFGRLSNGSRKQINGDPTAPWTR